MTEQNDKEFSDAVDAQLKILGDYIKAKWSFERTPTVHDTVATAEDWCALLILDRMEKAKNKEQNHDEILS